MDTARARAIATATVILTDHEVAPELIEQFVDSIIEAARAPESAHSRDVDASRRPDVGPSNT